MQLHLSTWPEIERYLAHSRGIIIPIGSTEQHGPTGVIGTDAICAEAIAARAGDDGDILVGPTFNVGSAQHHLAFPGSMSLRPSTIIAALCDWIGSLARHGFQRFYFLNGHGGNTAPVNAAFAEMHAARSFTPGDNAPALTFKLRNWWEFKEVGALARELYGKSEGSHATPSEIAVTQSVYPQAIKAANLSVQIAPSGPIRDAQDYRRRFPDGRIGSDPTLARPEHGARLLEVAAHAVVQDYARFVAPEES